MHKQNFLSSSETTLPAQKHLHKYARSALHLVPVLAAMLGSMPLYAAESTDTGPRVDDEIQVIEVVGRQSKDDFADSTFAATKTETHILDVSQSIGIVTKEIIQEQNLQQLNDIAPYVAGVNEFSVYDDLTIRGFRNQDDRRVNGLRVYNNFWSQPYIANVERVEVLKGPAAALYGDASPGGVINLVTKKPLQESRNEVQLDVGTYGDSRNQVYVAADSTGAINGAGNLLYRINASTWDADSFRDKTFDKGFSIAPSLSWLASENTRLNLEVTFNHRENVLDRGQPAIQNSQDLGSVPIERSVTQPGDGLTYNEHSIALSLDQKLTDNWRLAAAIMTHTYDEDLKEHRTNNTYASPSVINLSYNDRDTDADTTSGTVYVTGRVDGGALTHKVVVGVDAMRQENSSANRGANPVGTFDLLNPTYSGRDPSTYTFNPTTYSGEKNNRFGLFVQDQITYGQWDVLLGLRYSAFDTKPDDGEKTDDSDILPRLGVVYRINEDLSVYGTFATGFEPNLGYSSVEGGPFDPTRSLLYEVGAKWLGMDERLLVTTAIYQITNTDIVVDANDSGNPDLNRQVGEEQSVGFEIEANGQVTEDFSLIFNYAYNDAKTTKDTIKANEGKGKLNAPHQAATLLGRYNMGYGFRLGASVEFVSQRRTYSDTLVLDPYTIWNLGVYYKHENLDMSLLLKNVTNKEHWTGGYDYNRVFPGDPRLVTLSAKYTF